jgi:hypothetical protein
MDTAPPDPLERPTRLPRPPPRYSDRTRSLAIGLAVVLAIAATAVVLVDFGAQLSGTSGNSSPRCGPCGAGFAVATPATGRNGSAWTYTMTLTPSSGMTMGSLSFHIQEANGTPVSLPQAYVQVLSQSPCLVGEFQLSTGVWSNGPVTAPNACTPPGTTNTILSSGMQLYLSTGTNDLRGQGYVLVIEVDGTGTVYCWLP